MIRTEIEVFATLFGVGVGAGVLASFLLALGRGSRVARAIFDLLTPLAVGAIFFFALRRFASGVIRLYSVGAFALGMLAAKGVVGALAKPLSKLADRIKVPIKSLEDATTRLLGKCFAPLARRIAKGKEKRKDKRALRAAKRAELVSTERRKPDRRGRRAGNRRAGRRGVRRAGMRPDPSND